MSIALWCLFFAAFLHVGSKLPLAVAQTRDGHRLGAPREGGA
jgi:hypothetical protein